MTWIFLQNSEVSISSQESAESAEPLNHGCEQSHIVRTIDTAKVSYCPTCNEVELIEHLSGMTSEAFPRTCCHQLTSSSEDSLAPTLVLQEFERVWQESEADCFSRSFAWPKKSSPLSYSLRMSEISAPSEVLTSLEKLPKWGMTVDGVLSPLRQSEQATSAKDGFYWATPNTLDHMPPRPLEALKRQFLTARKGRTKPANLREQLHAECWPQNLFPTPLASDWKIPDSPYRRTKTQINLITHLNISAGKMSQRINLPWLEWLMQYPKGWTELEPWATQWLAIKSPKPLKS